MGTRLNWLEKHFPTITEAEHLTYVPPVDRHDGSGQETLRDTDTAGSLPHEALT